MWINGNKAFTKDQISKIGNTIIYLAERVQDLNKTKILKFLFLIEEASIKKSGKPFFGIDFQIWKFGPVAKDIYIDLTTQIFDDEPILLNEFIERNPTLQKILLQN
ncbi:MAG: type II toxin-antitoxin system antitoxin SocA domain-containing protein [Bacteroidota bacterium]